MPSYKTHAIHGEMLLPRIDKKTDIDKMTDEEWEKI